MSSEGYRRTWRPVSRSQTRKSKSRGRSGGHEENRVNLARRWPAGELREEEGKRARARRGGDDHGSSEHVDRALGSNTLWLYTTSSLRSLWQLPVLRLVADDPFCIGSDDGNDDQDRRPGRGPLVPRQARPARPPAPRPIRRFPQAPSLVQGPVRVSWLSHCLRRFPRFPTCSERLGRVYLGMAGLRVRCRELGQWFPKPRREHAGYKCGFGGEHALPV